MIVWPTRSLTRLSETGAPTFNGSIQHEGGWLTAAGRRRAKETLCAYPGACGGLGSGARG